jgi:hypothetical protein
MKNIALGCALGGFGLWIAMFDGCSSGSSGGSLDGGTATTTATTTTTGTGGGDLCSRACAKLDAVHCANDMPGVCTMSLCTLTVCQTERDAFLTCIDGATLSCSAAGRASTSECTPEGVDYINCLQADGGP